MSPLYLLFAPMLLLAAPATSPEMPDITASPTFFARHLDRYSIPANLNLMRQDSVEIVPHGVTSIAGFHWQAARGSRVSWTMDMEELIYLLPFIASGDDDDRIFARSWFVAWVKAHERRRADPVAWDWMTAGIRSMVLMFFLEREELDPVPGSIARGLRESLADHQAFLSAKGRFDSNSNHGMWEAMGLIETCRALPVPEVLSLGLERLLGIVTRSTSAGGFHMEHSPHYHFAFLKWLDEYIVYLETLPGFEWHGLDELRGARTRLVKGAFYLQDHEGRTLPIGDSFARPVVAPMSPGVPTEEVAFDMQAGYAVFKEFDASDWRRHVVFNIQGLEQPFPHHFHDDALAVFVGFAGETVLGDQGAYDYGRSQYRQFVRSASAHNLVAPRSHFAAPLSPRGILGAVSGAAVVARGDVEFSGVRDFKAGSVVRNVIVRTQSPSVEISDEVTGKDMQMIWNFGDEVTSVRMARAAPASTPSRRVGSSIPSG